MAPVAAPENLEGMREAISGYPGLMVRSNGVGAVIEGVLELSREEMPFESFLIQIQLADIPPTTQPRVFEIGGRIKREDANHINADGSLCLGVPEEIWLLFGGEYDLKRFLDDVVTPFLLGIACRLRGEEWPFGERTHGPAGICEFYGDRFGTLNSEHVLDIIDILLVDAPKGHWACPCGSGRKLRQCHQDALNDLRARRLPVAMLQRSANLIGTSIARKYEAGSVERRRLSVKMRRILSKT